MGWFRPLLIGLLLVECAHGLYFFVTAPSIFRYQHTETALVNIYDGTNIQIKIWLEHNGRRFSQRTVTVVDGRSASMQKVLLTISERDLFENVSSNVRPQHVMLNAYCPTLGVTKQSKVLISYSSGYLLVQTDKPIYSPGQKIYYRVLAMTESMSPLKNHSVFVDVIDPENRTIARNSLQPEADIYNKHFLLPKGTGKGLWTIRAFLPGQYRTEARACVQVEDYELPRFEVTIKPNVTFLQPDTEAVDITVEARYLYGKPVQGTAKFEVVLLNEKLSYRKTVLHLIRADLEGKRLDQGIASFVLKKNSIMNSPLVNSDFEFGFPWDGEYKLEIKSIVREDVSGDTESGSYNMVLTDSPYQFKFTLSRKVYRPGLTYNLVVDIFHVDGQPLSESNVTIIQIESNINSFEKTNKEGRVVYSYQTSVGTNPLRFKAKFQQYESKVFTVRPYNGKKQIHIGMIKQIEDNAYVLKVTSNDHAQQQTTDITMLVVARGTPLKWWNFRPSSDSPGFKLDDSLMSRMAPTATVLAFLVDKNSNSLVTDTFKPEITELVKCPGTELRLELIRRNFNPGEKNILTVYGNSRMRVGLNVIDNAVLLLNNKTTLKPDKIFKMMEAHDLGCKDGDGTSSEEQVKNAGLVILTNANFNNEERNTISCQSKSRRKRSLAESGVHHNCWDQGELFAAVLLEEASETETNVDLQTKCVSKTITLVKDRQLTAACISVFYTACIEKLSTAAGVTGKSFEVVEDYSTALSKYLGDTNIKVRVNFRDSWLFEEIDLDEEGRGSTDILNQDSITSWQMQAIGISELGPCIAQPLEFQTFKSLFIDLRLPMSAVRFEHVEIQVFVFNYFHQDKEVLLYLTGVEGLCSPAPPSKTIPIGKRIVPKNSAESFSFIAQPLEAGDFKIAVRAIVTSEQLSDGIEKELHVKYEGKELSMTIHACLDPSGKRPDCGNDQNVKTEVRLQGEVNLLVTFPKIVLDKAIPGTLSAVGYIKSNIIADVVNHTLSGTGTLFRQPHGCGEQTIASTAPNVYALYYLKQRKAVTKSIETKAAEHIEFGVNRELTLFRKKDNAFAKGQSYSGSTWLSAFVMKVFCQAQNVTDGLIVDDLHIKPTLKWLMTQQTKGVFKESGKVPYFIYDLNDQPELTAFVLTSIQECHARIESMDVIIQSSVEYLESLPNSRYMNDPYLLTMTAYALSMSGMTNDTQKQRFMEMLDETKHVDGESIYWGLQSPPQSLSWIGNSQTVEATSYALLAYLSNQKYDESGTIVQWLIRQREGSTFRSTKDTVVALQALAEYSIHTKDNDVNMMVVITSGKENTRQFPVANVNDEVILQAKNLYDPKKKGSLLVNAKGYGYATLDIELKYNVDETEAEKACAFKISSVIVKNLTNNVLLDPQVEKERDCDVCGLCMADPTTDIKDETYQATNGSIVIGENDKIKVSMKMKYNKPTYCVTMSASSESINTGMVLIKFGLQTGVSVKKEDLETLVNSGVIDDYELPEEGKGYIVFYLEELTTDPVLLKFRVTDEYKRDPEFRQMAQINIFEYYDPGKSCTTFYGINKLEDKPFRIVCPGTGKGECKCLRNLCAKRVKAKTRSELPRWLQKQVCSDGRPNNYVVRVQITKTYNDSTGNIQMADATVVTVIQNGPEILHGGSKITFRWASFCNFPNLRKDKRYNIVGLSTRLNTGNGTKYLYELMGDAAVFEVSNAWKGILKTYKCRT